MGISSRQNINKKPLDVNYTLDQIDLTDIYRAFYPTTAEHSILKHTWNILHGRSYFGTQNNLNKFKKMEIIPSIFSKHNGMKLKIYYKKKKPGKLINMWRLKVILVNSHWVKAEIKRKIKYLETNENGSTTYQSFCDAAKQF